MVAAASRKVARAMVAQLDRVNARSAAALDRPASTPSLRLREAYDIIDEQRRLIDALQQRLAQVAQPQRSTHQVNGRPVLTAAQAAAQAGVSLATVSRYVHSGHWQAAREPGSRRWLIYADQALQPKRNA